jgi:hypothetical protein
VPAFCLDAQAARDARIPIGAACTASRHDPLAVARPLRQFIAAVRCRVTAAKVIANGSLPWFR